MMSSIHAVDILFSIRALPSPCLYGRKQASADHPDFVPGPGVRSAALRKPRAGQPPSCALADFLGRMQISGMLDYEIHGREHLLQPGSAIGANHPGLIPTTIRMQPSALTK